MDTTISKRGAWLGRSALLIGLAACMPLSAIAAEVGGIQIEEVVVTAQKRTQNIQDVPISIATRSGDELRELGITSTQALASIAPGLIVNDYGNPVSTVFTLRGVSQLDFGDHQESPVAVFVDGSYIPYLSAVGTNLFDLERAEVLRGPQGTLFGRNATGGVIQLVSAKPTEEFSGHAQIDAGNYSALRAEAVISGPLGGGWLGRLAVVKDEHDGYFTNWLGPSEGDADDLSWRGQLFRPLAESGDLTLMVRGSHDNTSASPYQARAAYPDPVTGLIKSGDAAAHASFCAAFYGTEIGAGAVDCLSGDVNDGDPHTLIHNRSGEFERDHYGASATVNWDFGGPKLTSVTSFGHLKKDYSNEDSDGTSLDVLYFGQSVDATDYAQELRLAGTNGIATWTAGAYYLNIDGEYGGNVGFFAFDPDFSAEVNNRYRLETSTWAVFAQSELALAPHWTLTTGLRWTEDDKKFHMATPCTGPGCDLLGLTDPGIVQGSGYDDSVPGARTKRNSGNWDGKLQIAYSPDENLMLYGGVTRGTKAGGYNAGATAFFTVAETIFDDEVLTSYEIGAKSLLADGRIRLNGSVYYYDYNDIQVFNQLASSTVTFNNDGRIYGADLDLAARLAAGLDLTLGISLLDSEMDSIQRRNLNTGELVSAGKQEMTNSPHATLNAMLRKEWAVGAGQLALQGDVSWIGSRKLNLINHPATTDDAYTLANLRMSYAPEDSQWELAVYARNITDEVYRLTAVPFVDFTGSVIEIYGPPRTYGLSALMRF